jgi:hypothetical protein
MVLITGRAKVMPTTGYLVAAGHYNKTINWSRIVNMRKDATIHYPDPFGFSGINYGNASTAIFETSPYTINPARMVKAIHPGLEDFNACSVKFAFQ